jgi:hypothetical protein
MSNTISTKTYRDKYRSAILDSLLSRALVSEAVFEKDTSGLKTLQNPYGSQPTSVVTAINGTYTPATYTTTDDTLTVTDEIKVAEHVFDFEETLTNFDLFTNRTMEQGMSVAREADKYALNVILDGATGTYSTPAGGFATAANIKVIFSNLISKVSGYADAYKGYFIVLENVDIAGVIEAQLGSGFSYADQALKNGFLTNYAGVEIYVTRAGTYVDATIGTKTVTNAGHRLFGVKKVATFCMPGGFKFEEKGVSGKTGMEVVTYSYIGAKAWATKSDLLIDVTIVAS